MQVPQRPIGMLDSGLGGLTVLRTVTQLLPHENVIYFGDLGHSPYGGRPKAELIAIIEKAVAQLQEHHIKALVLASNTGTSAGAHHLRETLSIPVIGLEPAIKPAIQAARPGKILVLATQLTLKEEKFNQLYHQYEHQGQMLLKSCPGLVELIDNGILEGPTLYDFLANLFQDLKNEPIATIVLGCTHYIVIRNEILKHFPPQTLCLDGNAGVARHIQNLLEQHQLLNDSTQSGKLIFISSDPLKAPLLEATYQKLV